MVKVTIDDIEVEVESGTSILNAARMIGGEVVPPAMCYYSKLEVSGGKCRTCLVEVAAGSAADPRPMPKLVASCSTPVADGMVIKNKTSDRVKENRAGVVEFLLINHPLDCPICDQAGECHLQDLGYEHGKAKTRYEEERRTFDPIDIGDKIKLHMNRCILCYRCVHTANQLTDQRVHGVLNRGEHAEISTYIEKAIDNDFSGNVIDVCPVGALIKRFDLKVVCGFLSQWRVNASVKNVVEKQYYGCLETKFTELLLEKINTEKWKISMEKLLGFATIAALTKRISANGQSLVREW